jgi:hypothetical protein
VWSNANKTPPLRFFTDAEAATVTAMAERVFPADTNSPFFAMFLRNVTEGLFCDPMHGGNRDMVGWKWVGFPGDPTAYGEPYARHIGKWNQPYHVAPKEVQ